MVQLEYIIIFVDSGIPVWSHKFVEDFPISDDILFSAFLASINIMAGTSDANAPETIMIEEKPAELGYAKEFGLTTIIMEGVALVFHKVEETNVAIGIGVNPEALRSFTAMIELSQIMSDTSDCIHSFGKIDWAIISDSTYDKFNLKYLSSVVHNFIESHKKNTCILGENCPYEEEERPKKFTDRFRRSSN